MNDRTARIAMLLGLAPLTFAMFLFSATVASQVSVLQSHDFQFASAASTALHVTCVIVVWRMYVRWRRRQNWGVAILTLLVLAQLVFWQPMWAMPGCADEEILRIAQSSAALGLWYAGIVLLWWSVGALCGRAHLIPIQYRGVRPMSANAVRLSLGLALIPFMPGLFFIMGLGIEKLYGPRMSATPWALFACFESCGLIVVGSWILLWRSVVEWTPRQRLLTLLLVLAMLLAPVSVFVPLSHPWDILQVISPLLVAGIWFGGTAITWRARATNPERADEAIGTPPTCPSCRYNLTGLREVRCPECGWASTIDDVVRRSLLLAADG